MGIVPMSALGFPLWLFNFLVKSLHYFEKSTRLEELQKKTSNRDSNYMGCNFKASSIPILYIYVIHLSSASSNPNFPTVTQIYTVTVQNYIHPALIFCFKLLLSALWRQTASCKQVFRGLPLCGLDTLSCLNSTKIQPRWQCRAQYTGSCLQITSMPLTPTSPG